MKITFTAKDPRDGHMFTKTVELKNAVLSIDRSTMPYTIVGNDVTKDEYTCSIIPLSLIDYIGDLKVEDLED